MNARTARAVEMLKQAGAAGQSDPDTFSVRSQTDPDKRYEVKRTGSGLVCECPDHRNRGSDCKHIKVVLRALCRNQLFKRAPFRIMERAGCQVCKFCDSGNVVKAGMKKTKNKERQMFKCADCKKRFTADVGFEGKHFEPKLITRAVRTYCKGMSVRDIADEFETEGAKISHKTIYNWVAEYSRSVSDYLDDVVPRTSDRAMARADEVWLKIAGELKYLFGSMEDDTRYWLAAEMAETKFQHDADNLLEATKKKLGKAPAHFVTDGLPNYMKSSLKVFGDKTQHWRYIHLRKEMNNNKMERLNGTVREREVNFRGLKKFHTPLIPGFQAHYNCVKKHGGLDGRTPSDAALIDIDGPDRWKTLIQNAALHRLHAG